jgi:hypothetical protein
VQCIIVGEEDLVHTGLRGMVEAREDGGGGGSRRGWRWKADRLAVEGGPAGVGRGGGDVLEFTGGVSPTTFFFPLSGEVGSDKRKRKSDGLEINGGHE